VVVMSHVVDSDSCCCVGVQPTESRSVVVQVTTAFTWCDGGDVLQSTELSSHCRKGRNKYQWHMLTIVG